MAMRYFLMNLQWLIYKCQQRDIHEQTRNLNHDENPSVYSTTG